MSFWTDPYPAPGPAFEQSKFQLHAAPISGVLDSIIREREQQQHQLSQATQQAVSGLGSYMQKQQTDQIASQLLNQAAYQGYDEQGNMLGDPLARSLVENGPDHPTDAWTAYQQAKSSQAKLGEENAQMQRYQALAEQARAKAGSVGSTDTTTPQVYLPDGTPVKATAHDAFQYYYGGGGQPAEDAWNKAIPVARGKLDSGAFTNQYTGAEQGDQIELMTPQGKTIVVPYSAYQGRMGQQPAAVQHQQPQLPAGSADEAASSTLVPQGKQLDAQTAQQFLAQAGGDKDKARQLARTAGYTF